MSAEPRRAYADTPWGPIHFKSQGNGVPLLLLHSSSGSSRVFHRLMARLDGCCCIAPDLPGFGESAALPAGVSIEDVAAQVVCFLDAIEVERTHVFGMHSGNKVAAALAADSPQRVDRMVIAGMTHSLVVDASRRNAAMLQYAGRDAGPPHDGTQVLHGLRARLDHILAAAHSSAGAVDIERLGGEILDAVQARRGADGMYAANLAFDLPAKLGGVRATSLIMELTTDDESDLGLQGPLLAALMADGRSMTLVGNDRDLLQARPDELAGPLLSFLAGGASADF